MLDVFHHQPIDIITQTTGLGALVGKIVVTAQNGILITTRPFEHVGKIGIKHHKGYGHVDAKRLIVKITAIKVDTRRTTGIDHTKCPGGGTAEGHTHLPRACKVAGRHDLAKRLGHPALL